MFSGLLTNQGTLWNQSETIRTSKEPSGTSKSALKKCQRGDFKGDSIHEAFFQGYGRESKCPHISGYLVKPIRVNEDFITLIKNASILLSPFCRFYVPDNSFEVLIVSD